MSQDLTGSLHYNFVTVIVTGLQRRTKSEITEIVDEKYVFKIPKIQNFRNTRNQKKQMHFVKRRRLTFAPGYTLYLFR